MEYDLYINGNLYEKGFETLHEAKTAASSMGDWIDEAEILKDNTTVWCWPNSII
jgi:hypothetical protein